MCKATRTRVPPTAAAVTGIHTELPVSTAVQSPNTSTTATATFAERVVSTAVQ